MDDVVPADVQASNKLIHLHGDEDLLLDLTAIFSCGMPNFQHASACPDCRHACSLVLSFPQKRLLFLEERPVVTRLWLYVSDSFGFSVSWTLHRRMRT